MARGKNFGLRGRASDNARTVRERLDKLGGKVPYGGLSKLAGKFGMSRQRVSKIFRERTNKRGKKAVVNTKKQQVIEAINRSNLGHGEIERIAIVTKTSVSYVDNIVNELVKQGLAKRNARLPHSDLSSLRSEIRRRLLSEFKKNNGFPQGTISKIAKDLAIKPPDVTREKTLMKKESVLPKNADEK
ncbi:MAG TPA: hypothetical protein VFF13_04740 [archaeon]|nr:hypothetical protein [archaeon]